VAEDPFQLGRFAPLVGSRFSLRPDGGPALPAQLVDAAAARGAALNGRQPFSLIFEGPPEPLLPQSIYRVEHPALDAMDLFLVPVGRSPAGVRYEAVFT
jgi:hypothetical protein